MALKPKNCIHMPKVEALLLPREKVCEECQKINGQWVHLRTCQTCGATLCCDSSPNKHATKHFHLTGHPVITSAEPGVYWMYCYEDQKFSPYQNA